jgi:hypothetical protein
LAENNDINTALREELGDLITAFGWYADHGEAIKIPDLFTEDGRISAPGMDVEGLANLTELFEGRAKQTDRLSRHLWSNMKILSASDKRIELVVTATNYIGSGDKPATPETYVVGDSYETFEKNSEGAWRFKERRLDLIFKADN